MKDDAVENSARLLVQDEEGVNKDMAGAALVNVPMLIGQSITAAPVLQHGARK
jgi:hypothetical protein